MAIKWLIDFKTNTIRKITMKLSKLLFGALMACAFASNVIAQSSPGLTYGQVPTAGQWNGYFSAKQDVLGYTPLNQAGGPMLGPLKTAASTTNSAGFAVLPGVAPNVPNNGDIWLTSSGLYYRAGNITFGPIGAGTITGPTTTVVGHVAKWGNTTGTALTDGGALGTIATQDASAVAITGGSITGITDLAVADGGTGASTPSGARTNLGAAAFGANTDITSLSGLTTALSVSQGGTGGTSASAARTSLGAAASGANSDITSLSGLTTALSVAQGGTGGNTQATAQSSLGLGSMATQSASAVAVTGGTINGTTIGATTASTGRFTTVTATGAITPSSTAGIIGTTTNDNANAGSIGEYQSNSATGTNLPNSTSTNATSVSLTAGDWDVSGVVGFNPAGSTVLTNMQVGITTTSATIPTVIGTRAILGSTNAAGTPSTLVSPTVRLSLSATTTVYLVAFSSVTTSTATVDGFIRARRVR